MKFNRTIEQLAADVKRRVSESDNTKILKEQLVITDKEVIIPRMFIASGKWRAFVAVKRALKMGLGAGISAFVASGNPIAGLIAGGGSLFSEAGRSISQRPVGLRESQPDG